VHRKRRWSELSENEQQIILEKRKRRQERRDRAVKREKRKSLKRRKARLAEREKLIEKYQETLNKLEYERKRNAYLQDRVFKVALRKKGLEATEQTAADSAAAAAMQAEEDISVEKKRKKLSKLKARYAKLVSFLYHIAPSLHTKTLGVCGVTGSQIQDAIMEKLRNRLKPFDMFENVRDDTYRIVQDKALAAAESRLNYQSEFEFIAEDDEEQEEEADGYDSIFMKSITDEKKPLKKSLDPEDNKERGVGLEDYTAADQMQAAKKVCVPEVNEKDEYKKQKRQARKEEAKVFLNAHMETLSWTRARRQELASKKYFKELKLANITEKMQKLLAKQKAFMHRTETSIQSKEVKNAQNNYAF